MRMLPEMQTRRGRQPQGFVANAVDFVKSIPRGAVSEISQAGVSAQMADPGYMMGQMMGQPSLYGDKSPSEAAASVAQTFEDKITGPLHKPETPGGHVGAAVGGGLANPINYFGPGKMALKVGGAVLSSAGSEAAGQAAEGTGFETPARLAGGLAGGVAAAKALGPTAPKAANPTYRELKGEADRLYMDARNSGVEFDPKGVSTFATRAEQELSGANHGFTGGLDGDAPKTFAILGRLQNPPPGATITASNVDALRKNIGRLARETKDHKPTPDAAAASILLSRLNGYLEAPPSGHVVAGDPQRYVRATKEANANYAAGQRLRDWQTRLDNAELDASGQIAGSLENRQKIASRQILKSPKASRGMDDAEKSQLELINSGGPVSNTLRNLGRGGAGVVPIAAHLAAAVPAAAATGGASVLPQAALAAVLFGARKGSEAITNSRVKKLAEMLGQRSPLYEQRKASLPPADTMSGKAAIARALLGSQ
jgi:hypothetical protein